LPGFGLGHHFILAQTQARSKLRLTQTLGIVGDSVQLVTTKDQIVANIVLFENYQSSSNPVHRSYFCERLRLGKIFVFAVNDGRPFFCPSRFAGYENCTVEKHQAFSFKNGSITTPAITRLLGAAAEDNEAEKTYLALCSKLGLTPSAQTRTYWRIELPQSTASGRVSPGEPGFPDEVDKFVEGATKRVLVNAYERSPLARLACLVHHGYNCSVCDFNFQAAYGSIGAKFIHVHHLTPISTVAGQHKINPVTEMRPVCPNCHAMLHKSDPPFTIEELQQVMQNINDT
jgi:5-methylcytosine-specific restriction protein A